MDETQKFDPQEIKEEAAKQGLEETQAFEPVEEFSLEDIMKEFSSSQEEEQVTLDLGETQAFEPVEAESAPLNLEETQAFDPVEAEEKTVRVRPAENLEETQAYEPVETEDPEKTAENMDETRVLPDVTQAARPAGQVTSDTIRLDAIDQAELQVSMVQNAQPVEEEEEEENADPFTASWEPDYDQPMGEYIPPQPIIVHPRSRLKELKKKLVSGPEKQYYKLSEKGLGKLQAAIFFSILVVLLAATITVCHVVGLIRPERIKFMIFVQLLVMLVSALLGSFQLVEGVADLLKKRFSMNSLLVFTFVACCADGVLCLMDAQRIPCCAAFSLTMTMSLWSAYHKRYTEMGQMDTLRKANHLDGVGVTEEFYEGDRGLLRFEGQVEDFMDEYYKIGGPEKRLNLYSLIALFVSIAVGIAAAVLQYLSNGLLAAITGGVQVLAVTLLAALPATAFISVSRPFALLERKLHQVGTVICGWKGVGTLCGKAAFPLLFGDLFPAGTVNLNGVKFYGNRMPDDIVAYATAVMEADGGGLAPLFTQLLASRNGMHYEVAQLRAYDNGGIGAEVEGEAVLIGSMTFLKEMGVEIPEGVHVNHAVYMAIDGELSGVFAISYDRDHSSGAGLVTLCSYKGLKPVLVAHDFALTPGFLKSKFGINPKRVVMPDRKSREALSQVQQEPGSAAAVLVTKEGLAPFAYGVTGARALRTASNLGVIIHLLGGILGIAIMVTLTVLGQLQLLTPANMFLYHLVWLIPGFLTTEWTRSI